MYDAVRALVRQVISSQTGTVNIEGWIAEAVRVREQAYAPYSKFPVGAALVAQNGAIFAGCNVENLSFGLTICAERVAIGSAVAAGVRSFAALVVVADTTQPVSPCGACRQVLAEFNPKLEIWLCTLAGERERFTLDQLLPRASTGILDRE
jgi:cytidine deaminase